MPNRFDESFTVIVSQVALSMWDANDADMNMSVGGGDSQPG